MYQYTGMGRRILVQTRITQTKAECGSGPLRTVIYAIWSLQQRSRCPRQRKRKRRELHQRSWLPVLLWGIYLFFLISIQRSQREAMDATFKWIFKRKSTLSVLGLPEDLRGSPKTLHSWAGVALHYVRWPVGGVRWCRQPGSKGKWLQSRGNTIRNYKSSSKCLTNAAYCCANFVIYKSFKFTEFTNKQLSITPSQ